MFAQLKFSGLLQRGQPLQNGTYSDIPDGYHDAFPQWKLAVVRDKLIHWYIIQNFTKY